MEECVSSSKKENVVEWYQVRGTRSHADSGAARECAVGLMLAFKDTELGIALRDEAETYGKYCRLQDRGQR